MSPRPGVEVTSSAARGARGEPTDTGVAFLTGFADRGPSDRAVRVTSVPAFVREYGERPNGGVLYDALDVFFSEGGAEAYVGRVVGPAAAKASVTFNDGAAGPALTVEALYEGAYANGAAGGLSAEIAAGGAGTFTVVIYEDGEEVERFTDLADTAAAVAALTGSQYVRGVDPGAVGDPAVAGPTDLAGGDDDSANATDAEWQAALDLFAADLGPGQVLAPGRTTGAAHDQLVAHASSNNRTALLDTAYGATEAAMLAAAAALADDNGAEYAGLFGGWVIVPSVINGVERAVPPSAYAAGVIARLDARTGVAGFAAAGDQGSAQYALDVVGPATGPVLTADDYETLNAAGVNMVRAFRTRGVQLYGFRTVSSDPEWQQLSAQRQRMSLHARLNAIALGYVFRTIDGRGQLYGELNGALVGECMLDYQAGVLYGATPEEAFRVDTADPVNTAETAEAGEINAEVYARFSPFAELVRLSITKVAITGRV